MYRGFKIFLCASLVFIFFGAVPTYAHYEVVTEISKDRVTASLNIMPRGGGDPGLGGRPISTLSKIFSTQELIELFYSWRLPTSAVDRYGYDDDFFEENFLVIYNMNFSEINNELSITSFSVNDSSINVNVSELRVESWLVSGAKNLVVEIPLSMAHKDILITDRRICVYPLRCVRKIENCRLCENCDSEISRQRQCVETPCPHHTSGDSSDIVRVRIEFPRINQAEAAGIYERFMRQLNEMLTEAGFAAVEMFNIVGTAGSIRGQLRVPKFLLNAIDKIPEPVTWEYLTDLCRTARPTEENCAQCVDCDAPLPRICSDDEPCAYHFIVPQTGVGDVTVYVATMFAFFAVAVGLWGRLFFTGAER